MDCYRLQTNLRTSVLHERRSANARSVLCRFDSLHVILPLQSNWLQMGEYCNNLPLFTPVSFADFQRGSPTTLTITGWWTVQHHFFNNGSIADVDTPDFVHFLL